MPYFFIISDPLANVTLTGSNWLKQGDPLSLEFKCTGSPPFEYCLKYSTTPFNNTGNLTCTVWAPLETCQFHITHYYYFAESYSILIIMRNQVTLVNKEITIKVYNVKKQSQLSVIVVPIVFILAAVISVVFGVAYYVQNRDRCVIFLNI